MLTENQAKIIADTLDKCGLAPASVVPCTATNGRRFWSVKTHRETPAWIDDPREVGNAILQLTINKSSR